MAARFSASNFLRASSLALAVDLAFWVRSGDESGVSLLLGFSPFRLDPERTSILVNLQ